MKRLHFDSQSAREFEKVFYSLAERHNGWTVWTDFITVFACSIANVVEHCKEKHEEREKLYAQVMQSYSDDEKLKMSELASIVIEALTENPHQDFLGSLYMSMDFGSTWHGQFFTPWSIAYMMSKMTMHESEEKLQRRGYCSVNDCACGAGCMLIAAAAAYQDAEGDRNFQTDLLFVAQDVDRVVALMCYIQLSLLGCAGYVAIGNTLTNPVCGSALNPVIGDGGELWFTPMWYSLLWQFRRVRDSFELQMSHSQTPDSLEVTPDGQLKLLGSAI